MNNKELIEAIDESAQKDWLNQLELKLNFEIGQHSVSLKGMLDIYSFVVNEQVKWTEQDEHSKIVVFKDTLSWFDSMIEELNAVIKGYKSDYFARRTTSRSILWENVTKKASAVKHVYLRDFAETQFIIDLYKQNSKYAVAANAIFTNSLENVNLNNADLLFGAMMTYEFKSKGMIDIISRKEVEEKNINALRTELRSLLRESEEKTRTLQTELEEIDKTHRAKLESLNKSAEKSVEHTDGAHKDALRNLVEEAEGNFSTLLGVYEKKLQLEKPAEYWETRSTELRKSGYWWLAGLMAASAAGLILIIWLIFSLKEHHIAEHINNPAISIRWSILSIILLTLIAFLVRVFTKMMMSNFHLYRDAQERKQLTYFYLALSNNTEVSEADRSIILQSLFSRVDTGLLKDDSGPTMPSSVIDKLNNQG